MLRLNPLAKSAPLSLNQEPMRARLPSSTNESLVSMDSTQSTMKSALSYVWEKLLLLPSILFQLGSDLFDLLFSTDIFEDIIEAPGEVAEEFKENPEQGFAKVITATLINPKKVATMRADNLPKIHEFVKEFKNRCDKTGNLFGNNDVRKGLRELVSIFNGSSKAFQNHLSFIQDHQDILVTAFVAYCKKVVAKIGDKRNPKVQALKTVFGSYLPKVAQKSLDKPDDLKAFIANLYNMGSFKPHDMLNFIHRKQLGPEPNGKEKAAIELLTAGGNQVLREMDLPQLIDKELKGCHIGAMGLRQSIFEHLDQNALQALANHFQDFPLLKCVFEELKEIQMRSMKQYKQACINLPESLKVLKTLYNDYTETA